MFRGHILKFKSKKRSKKKKKENKRNAQNRKARREEENFGLISKVLSDGDALRNEIVTSFKMALKK